MEGLEINTIPAKLLARILLQLPTLPPIDNIDLMAVLAAGLERYGNTDNMNAFLDYCQSIAIADRPWPWKCYEITNELDWDTANYKKPQELVGLRFLLSSETARKQVQLTRYAKNALYDPKCIHFYQGRPFAVDQLLSDTLNYFRKEHGTVDSLVENLIELRLEQFSRDRFTFQQQSNQLDNSDYHLMGALMLRYDSTATKGASPRSWCLYLRSYIEDAEGSIWRILMNDNEEASVTSEQALADIRGMITDKTMPSVFSKDYRPVYLFYGNLDLLMAKDEHVITLDDYTFDDEYEYESPDQVQPAEEPPEEEESCMHCGIKEIVNDVNDMFFCEYCNRGVHQLCEEPPIAAAEKDLDPWYCRGCCKVQNIPLRSFTSSLSETPRLEDIPEERSPLPSVSIKRKRDTDEEDRSDSLLSNDDHDNGNGNHNKKMDM